MSERVLTPEEVEAFEQWFETALSPRLYEEPDLDRLDEVLRGLFAAIHAAWAERDAYCDQLEDCRHDLITAIEGRRSAEADTDSARRWARAWKRQATRYRGRWQVADIEFMAECKGLERVERQSAYWKQYAEDSDAAALEWRRQRDEAQTEARIRREAFEFQTDRLIAAESEVARLTALVEQYRQDSQP